MKQLEVSILGQVYMLGCPEGGEALLQAAGAAVDREMSSIRDSGKVKARERIAVLTALNLAYQRAEHAHVAPLPASSAAVAVATEAGTLDVDHLIRRIDQALGDDGQLL